MKDFEDGLNLLPLPSEVAAGRIPKWELDRLVHRHCPVCGADDPRPICRRPDRLSVARCPACEMIYLPEIPNERNLAEFYRDYGEYKGLDQRRRSWLRRLVPFRSPHPFIEILERSGGLDGKSLCEFGCSFGGFLSRARDRGANVFGVEVDERALQHLRQEGLSAAKTLDTNRPFDIVCAFQLIEHLDAPAVFIEQADRVLKADGRLLLALPNGGEAEKVGPAWIGYRVDLEHLNYFSVALLSRLLREHHLYVEHFWEYAQPNVPRRGTAPGVGPGWLRRTRERLSQAWGEPDFNQGTFVLCVLARKVVS